MIEKLRLKILTFIYSSKDVPFLAGFSIGLYMILYYYSKNLGLANSLQQLLFFTGYYMLLPIVVIYAGYKILKKLKGGKYVKQFLFIATILFISFYLMQISYAGVSKKYLFVALAVVTVGLSFRLKQYYKFLILMIFFLSLFNLYPFFKMGYIAATANDEWRKLPDDINNIVFKDRPNIYYIQPDGYTSFKNLRDTNYNYNNAAFEDFLKQNGFKLYENFRSNYYSTLLSNTSMFSMKHHYIPEYVEKYAARSIIMGTNPVLHILKNNDYKTHFISEKPFMEMNRPKSNYDYSNYNFRNLPYLKDGWFINEDVFLHLQNHIQSQQQGGNFYFLEKFSPGHIHGLEVHSAGAEAEKKLYIDELQVANEWLTKVISYIEKKDSHALIIIAADHGGFVGFDYTGQSNNYTKDKLLVNSIFGVAMAVKWNNPKYKEFDARLATSVNLFRTVFSFLANDKKYLKNLQEDASYIRLEKPAGLYKYIDEQGNVVFDKKD